VLWGQILLATGNPGGRYIAQAALNRLQRGGAQTWLVDRLRKTGERGWTAVSALPAFSRDPSGAVMPADRNPARRRAPVRPGTAGAPEAAGPPFAGTLVSDSPW